MKYICSSCFSDKDIKQWIKEEDDRRGCYACKTKHAPTAEFNKLVKHLEECISRYYGRAIEQLGYCSQEGGYLGNHWDAWEMLRNIDLDLPRDDSGDLFNDIASSMTDEPWCEFDVGAFDLDIELRRDWTKFCEIIKHERRFFFHERGNNDRESLTPHALLEEIAKMCENLGLLRELKIGTPLWRARPDLKKNKKSEASDFGPPPPQYALQSNRMNPSGIPMLYVASTKKTALYETKVNLSKVGLWRNTQPLKVLDLRSLPPIPGIFSEWARTPALMLNFLHEFRTDIMKPVARDERVHIDYLPSQVVTEFMRDHQFKDGKIDGIAYGSTVHKNRWNVAIFIERVNLIGIKNAKKFTERVPLAFEKSVWAKIS